MACYIVSYDLCTPGHNYEQLYQALKSYTKWAKVNESVWAIVTDQTAEMVRNYLAGFLDVNDRIFVVRSGVEAAWRNPICRNQWLQENL